MKHFLLISVSILLYNTMFGQNEKLTASYSKKACICVDTIEAYELSKEAINKRINKCITKQTKKYFTKVYPDSTVLTSSAHYKELHNTLKKHVTTNCNSCKQLQSEEEKVEANTISSNIKAQEIYTQANAALQKNKYEKAIKLYNEALKIDSMFAYCWNNLGTAYKNSGDLNKAAEYYNKAIQIAPRCKMPLSNLAITYKQLKEYEKSKEAFQYLKRIDAANPEVYYEIGVLYYSKFENNKEALINMCKAYRLYDKNNSKLKADAENAVKVIYESLITSEEFLMSDSITAFYNVPLNSKNIPTSSIKFTVPKDIEYKNADDYRKQEDNVVLAAKWLEETPLDVNETKRADVNAFVYKWIIETPTVTIRLSNNLTKLSNNNIQLFFIYCGSYSRYFIENKTKANEKDGIKYALKSIIKVYKKGIKTIPNKDMEKLIQFDKENRLDEYITKYLMK